MNNNNCNYIWNKFDGNNIDKRLIKGRNYLIVTFNDHYRIAMFIGKEFLGFPYSVKAWSEFKRYDE